MSKLGGWRVELPSQTVHWTDETCAIHDVPPGHRPTVEEAFAFYVPEDRDRILHLTDRCVGAGVPFDEEFTITTAKRRQVWIRVLGEAHRSEHGDVTWVHGAVQDISERKQAEARERELAGRLRHTLENISDGFLILDDAWRFTYINPRAEALIARTGEELVGRRLWDVFSDEATAVFRREYERAVREQRTVAFESYDAALGTWYSVRAYPLEAGLAVYFTDVTEVRRALRAQRDTEQRFLEMAENVRDVFYNHDPLGGRMLYVSPAYETIWGRTCESLYERPSSYLDGVHRDDRELLHNSYVAHLSGEPTSVEYRVVRPDGQVRWVRDQGCPVMGEDGRLLRVVGAARDITTHRLAEESLRQSEERFRLFAGATKDAVYDWDMASDRVWWSEGLEALFGYSADRALSSGREWLQRVHADDRERVEGGLSASLEGQAPRWHAEYRFERADGIYAEVSDRGFIIRDDAQRAVRMVGGMTDLTEKKSLERQLMQSQRMEAIGHLAGGVAHDFNNLLTIINGYSELMYSALPPTDEHRELVSEVLDAGRRAANLTRQLLAFSRKQVLAPQVLDLNEAVRGIEKLLRRLLGEDISIHVDLYPDLAAIEVDPGQLEQVIVNLAVNARDAMPGGGRLEIATRPVEIRAPQGAPWEPREGSARREPRGTLTGDASATASPRGGLVGAGVSASNGRGGGDQARPGRYVALLVTDDGCGMTAEVQAQIFEPFFTTKEVGKGTGLGLSTLFGIIKQSHGHIDVFSQPGVGTRFRILFPAVQSPADHTCAEVRSVSRGSETILLVEDEPGVRDIARLALEAQGYRVLEAGGGEEALRLFAEHQSEVRLVITDVIMPEMSGRELVERLRAQAPALGVLYMSGYTDDAVVRHGVVVASDAFLQKPFSPSELAAKVREVLDRAPRRT